MAGALQRVCPGVDLAPMSRVERFRHVVADRFLVMGDSDRVDLAPVVVGTDLSDGSRVEIIVGTCGGDTEQRRWAARCDRFARLWHRFVARLVDYGGIGPTYRFEAWRVDGGRIAAREHREALHVGSAFLRASGWTVGALDRCRVRMSGARQVILPAADTGFDEVEPVSVGLEVPREGVGLATVPHDATSALVDVLDDPGVSRCRVLSVAVPPGWGEHEVVRDLARAARLRGFVPLAAGLAHPAVLDAVRDRSICIIARSTPVDAWEALLRVTSCSARAHVLLLLGRHESFASPLVRVPLVSGEILRAAVCPQPVSSRRRALVAAAVRAAGGLPARFASMLWKDTMDDGTDSRQVAIVRAYPGAPTVPRVAEAPHAYGFESYTADDGAGATRVRPWPVPGELVHLRSRVQAGIASLAAGRHAAGERALREVGASLARRRDWRGAAEAALALASAQLRRGRTREADAALADAQRAVRQVPPTAGTLVQLAVLTGRLAACKGQLDDAESVLSAAVESARGLDVGDVGVDAGVHLAECLFLRGQYDAARRALVDPDESSEWATSALVRVAAGRAKAAAGAGDLKGAIAEAAKAHTMAASSGEPGLVACAAIAQALAHLVVNDLAAVGREVDAGLRAARVAREPLLSIDLRLLRAEADRRLGRPGRAATLVHRLRGRRTLPLALAVRVELLREVLAGAAAGETAAKIGARTGVRALTCYVPASGQPGADVPLTAGIVEILNCCQTADEERTVLVSLCRSLKARLRALGVAIVREEPGGLVWAASDGAAIDEPAASHVLSHEQPMLPGAGTSRPVGGAPIRYGGRRLGALVVRWAPTASWDGGTGILLATAAAAAAPAVAALLAEAPRADEVSRLVGVSSQMDDVRRAVDRAARSPFAVLVLGESGSGKELVARAVHKQSTRRDRPFCTVNCAALPDDLVESELFGHARGAFTGAVSERPGVFEEAHTGTLFLDEVGELSPRAQAKILRTIQDGELRRVGENLSRRVDVRLVAATNRDLTHEVKAGRFRLDLLYRLDVLRVVVPPLRERRDDVVVLAEHFWRDATARIGSRATLGAAVLASLARYDWPGNVRELQNVLAALAVRSPRRGVVQASALPVCFGDQADRHSCRLDDARRTFERHFIRAALARSGGHRARAASELGLSRQGLTKLIGRLGITDAS